MIVVVIIGLLAAMAIPAFQRVQQNSRASAFVNDLKKIEDAIDVYNMEVGTVLQDYNGGEQPTDLIPYLTKPDFTIATPLGGLWDWDNHSTYYRISVIPMDQPTVQIVDDMIDDGNTGTGNVQFSGGFRYYTWNAP